MFFPPRGWSHISPQAPPGPGNEPEVLYTPGGSPLRTRERTGGGFSTSRKISLGLWLFTFKVQALAILWKMHETIVQVLQSLNPMPVMPGNVMWGLGPKLPASGGLCRGLS